MNLPKDYISYSQIRTYQTCPRKYYYAYIKEIEVPVNDKIYLGLIFHSVLEYYFKEKIAGGEPGLQILLDYLKDGFQKGQEEKDVVWTTPAGETLKRGISFTRHFLKEIAPEIKPMMVEKELEVPLPDIDVKLKGILDLVETDFTISDFKTTTTKWSKSRIKASYLQMQIYRYLFERSFGNVTKGLKFRIIYSKTSSNIKNQEISVQTSDLDSSKMLDIITYVVENIQKGSFYKNEDYACGFCEYRDLCLSS
jgi:CRISPR/Cas system-associated exonuclease Cas4 (RecB family)